MMVMKMQHVKLTDKKMTGDKIARHKIAGHKVRRTFQDLHLNFFTFLGHLQHVTTKSKSMHARRGSTDKRSQHQTAKEEESNEQETHKSMYSTVRLVILNKNCSSCTRSVTGSQRRRAR